jgi:hypothetical protein
MRNTLKAFRDRHAKLPWKELEAEAARQRCSPADIFFDRAGRITGVPAHAVSPPVPAADISDRKHEPQRP